MSETRLPKPAYARLMRKLFDQAKVHPSIQQKISEYQAPLLAEVERAIQEHQVVVVGMSQNPFPGRARKLLNELGVPYKYLGYGSYLSQYRRRLVFKMWTGWTTFPMIFINQTFVGGFSDLKKLADTGELANMLSRPHDP